MGAINLPASLDQMFDTLGDRLSRVELGYSSPQASADAAQGTAVQASTQATQAITQATLSLQYADIAIAQATTAIATANSASAQAIQASLQAGQAQTSANGKSTSHYSTSGPSGTGADGDLWFQTDSGGTVLYQFIYKTATGWTSAPISNSVIANLDAGKINAGVITGIAYNNGSGTFAVTAAGALTATSATITGNITATSGTFTGTVYASSGSFTGAVYASSGSFTGAVYASSGSFTGSITSTSGSIGGWSISSTQLYSGSTYMSSATGVIYAAGSLQTNGTVIAGSGLTVSSGTSTFGGTINANGYIYNAGYASTSGATNMRINTTSGLIAYTSSSERYKVEIEPQEIPVQSVLRLIAKSYVDKAEYEENDNSSVGLQRWLGLIAEDIAELPVLKDLLVEYKDGEPNSVYYDRIAVVLLPLLQEHEARLNRLEGK
jgi:hypothetical protein